jgi:hypothetical protein
MMYDHQALLVLAELKPGIVNNFLTAFTTFTACSNTISYLSITVIIKARENALH